MEELLTLAEKEIVEESLNAVRPIADRAVKTKAYYNALAANSVINYLRQKGLINGDIHNLHDSAKMLTDFEIADIQLPNLHIDVRAVFDEDEIFIPKKHFYNNILPDIYLVLKLDEDLTNGTLLGFVEPSKINKQNQNDDYYFVNKSFLTPVSALENLILSSSEKTQYMITEVTEGSIEKLIMLYMDHDLDNTKLEKLLDYLKNSAVAREKLVEFENFERLSALALKEFKDLDVENNDFTKYIKTLVTTDEFATFEHDDELSYLFNKDSAPVAGGLFIDEEPEADVQKETSEVEQEVYEESEVLGSEDEESLDVENAVDISLVDEAVEEAPLAEEIVDMEEIPAPELEDEPAQEIEEVPVDEFEAFDAVDEFEQEEKVSTGEEPAAVEEEVIVPDEEPVGEEHELVLDSDELTIEAGDVLNIEFPAESAATEDEATEAPVLPEEALSGDDLELQIDGLENISEELDVNGVELENINLEHEETPVVEDIEAETTVEEEPVAAIEEPVVESVEEPVIEESAEDVEISDFDLDGLEFETEDAPVEETKEELAVEVESVSDEDVDNAIALSELDGLAVEEQALSEPVHEEVNEISKDEESENGEFSLDELLTIENDLSSAEAAETPKTPVGFKFDDEEEVEEKPEIKDAPTEDDLALLSAELDDDTEEPAVEEQPELINATAEASEQNEEAQEEEDEGTDFAFAVDSKPAKRNLLAPIAALVTIIGLAGVGAWYFLFNGKSNNNEIGLVDEMNNNNSIEDITIDVNDVTPAQSGNDTVADIQVPSEAVPAKDETKKPEETPLPAVPAVNETKKADAKTNAPADVQPVPEPLTLQKIKKDFSQPNTYLSVSKIVWDVPEYLTYNDDFSGYLQTLGSTLKLNLSSDLLLVSENTIFDKIRVRVELKDSGKKFSAEISDGCGAKAVDDLVLQSVKNTLNLLKPPVNSLDTADENLYITIYL